jgi:outer membrane receptor protein involved in Fe transport
VSLNPTYINNFDLRFEKYGESGNFFAVSGFYKNFQDPIEIVMYQRSPRQFRPQNSEEANVYGLEVELRQKILNNDIYNLGLNVNASVIESRQKLVGDELDVRQFDADALGVELDEYRRLQGQSPYLVNTSLVYKRNLSELSLFYNVQGKTLMFVGNDDVSDVFSVPFHSLNLIARKSFGNGDKQQIQLEVQNILGDVREVQYEFFNADPVLFSQRRLGRTFAVTYRVQL